MCSYITEQVTIDGSAKGPTGWMTVDRATVYYDHPYHAPFDHSLNIDLVNASEVEGTRVALELSAESARALVRAILAALEQGEQAHRGS
ncbi:MAG: hypothetical protein H0X37_02065 [Herpetosiphonaceae bacterium]|nr:hypothetical protein [Herpetosiphonaceae bacterium]